MSSISPAFHSCCRDTGPHHKKETRLQGLKIKVKTVEYHFKIAQYADDCTVCISSFDQIPVLFEKISQFSDVAGLKLNIDKTEGMGIGPWKDTEGIIHGVNFRTTPVKFLGIYVGNDPEKCKEKNWDEKLKKKAKELIMETARFNYFRKNYNY